MKNLKKVLALVLAFACAFTMFAGAVVYPDVAAGSEFSEAVTMLSDLGVIQGKDDGKYHPEDTITRAEACALIARMLTGDPQVTQYAGASNFTDVVKGSWKESVIGYCVVNGITVGVGNNKFEPDRAITDAEFVTMVVRAMGYETTGTTYPYGHISAAQANGLLDGVSVVPSSAALRGEDAQIMYNALFADYARGAKMINTTHGTSVEEYDTIAHSVFGLDRAAAGEWKEDKDTGDDVLKTCKAHTWVITGKHLVVDGKTNMVEALPIQDSKTELYEVKGVDTYAFEYEGDISGLKGYQVELWGSDSHNEPELKKAEDGTKVYAYDWDIKAVKTVKGQAAYDFNPTMQDDKENGTIKTDAYEVDLDNVQAFYGLDGKLISTKDDKKIEIDLNTKNSASYKLVDWDSDGSIDYIVRDIYDYYKVKSVSKKTVRLAGFNGKTAFTLDTDGSTDVTIDGQKYTVKAEFPDDLKEDDIIQVSKEDVVGKKKIESTWTIEVVEPESKEVTKVTSKKGVEFDDEKIDVADKDYSFDPSLQDDAKSTVKVYEAMNEYTADDWDLFLDANGYIVDMRESDSSWTGYLFVTGAENGDKKNTGSKGLALVSGKNDKNEVLDEVKLASDASVEVAGNDDAYSSKNRAFEENVVGKVFHYVYDEDDKEITKMIEVATDGTADDYAYVEKTRAFDVKGDTTGDVSGRYWTYDSSVIFAVKGDVLVQEKGKDVNFTTAGETGYQPIFGDKTDREADAKDVVGNVTNESFVDVDSDYDDIDVDDVIAVAYDEIPDIEAGNTASNVGDTHARGVRFDYTSKNDKASVVVLGVDKLDDFTNVSTKVGLLTSLDYVNRGDKKDTYEVEAYVAGMEEVTTNTIDYEDVKLNGTSATKSKLDEISKTVGTDKKQGIYVELKFNKDGDVTAINTIEKNFKDHTDYANVVDDTKVDPSYVVVRAVVNRYGSDNKTLMIAPAKGINGGDLESVRNSAYKYYGNLNDDTAYFEIDGKPVIADGKYMNAYEDAFKKPLKVSAESDAALDSFIENLDKEYTDEYIVADVILEIDGAGLNDLDVAAVYAFSDEVKEYGVLNGELTLNNGTDEITAAVAYDEQDVSATVACTAKELDTDRVYVEVWTTKTDKADAAKVYTSAVGKLADTFDLPTLDANAYTVTAYGYNEAAGKYQPIDSKALEIALAEFGEAEITVNPRNNQQVVLSGVEVEGLTADNFTIYQNSTKLSSDMFEMKYDEAADTYNFLIKAGADVTDDFTIVISAKNYNDKEVKYVGEENLPDYVEVELSQRDMDATLDNGTGGLFDGVDEDKFYSYTISGEDLGIDTSSNEDVTIKQTNVALNKAYVGSFPDNTKEATYTQSDVDYFSFLVGVDQKQPVKLEVTIGGETRTFTFLFNN